jgi:hypothetical protein
VASSRDELQRSSTRLKPRKTSGRNALDRREMTTTFSRPVSRLTLLIRSRGREMSAMLMETGAGWDLMSHNRSFGGPLDADHAGKSRAKTRFFRDGAECLWIG